MFSSINKTFVCRSKIFGRSNKNLFVVPNFVAVTKPFSSVKSSHFLVHIFTLTIFYGDQNTASPTQYTLLTEWVIVKTTYLFRGNITHFCKITPVWR